MTSFIYAIASVLGAILVITGIDAFFFFKELFSR